MSDKKRGIVDPWKVTSPRGADDDDKVDLDQIDHDADLVERVPYVIRGKLAAFSVDTLWSETPGNALEVLAYAIISLGSDKALSKSMLDARVGAKVRETSWNPPSGDAACLEARELGVTIWFHGTSLDRGMLALVRALNAPSIKPWIKKWGITPMLVN